METESLASVDPPKPTFVPCRAVARMASTGQLSDLQVRAGERGPCSKPLKPVLETLKGLTVELINARMRPAWRPQAGCSDLQVLKRRAGALA